MPSCAVSACISALAITSSSPNLQVWTGRSCLHTSCFAHLGISVKMHDRAQLAAPRCLHINVNPPLHSPFNRLSPRMAVWVSGCPYGQSALPQSLTHLLQQQQCWFVAFSVPVLCVEIHNKVLQKLTVLKADA